MKLKRSLLTCVALAAGIQASCTFVNANTVYTVNFSVTSPTGSGNSLVTDSVVGTMTTDGTLGLLVNSNFVAWNLQLIDANPLGDITLTQANSCISESRFCGTPITIGSTAGLSASATGLTFNFAAIPGSASAPGFGIDYSLGGSYPWINLSGGYEAVTALPQDTRVWISSGVDNVDTQYNNAPLPVLFPLDQTVTPIITPTPTPSGAAPEPATFALIGAGLGIAGLVGKLRSER